MPNDVFVVIGTYNRGHLLSRSLECYLNGSTSPKKIFILDDDSTDDTESICSEYDEVEYIKLKKPTGVTWRDSASFINMGIRECLNICKSEDIIICTHPEVMPGTLSIKSMSLGVHDEYVCCKPYYLTPIDQERIDTVPWKEIGASTAVRQLPDFYKVPPKVAGGVDYSPKTIEKTSQWQSWVFGGMTAQTWKKIGGMSEHNAWGSIDITFFARRNILGIKCNTAQDLESYCVHQNHDDATKNTITPRDMDLCHKEAHKFSSPIQAIYNHL